MDVWLFLHTWQRYKGHTKQTSPLIWVWGRGSKHKIYVLWLSVQCVHIDSWCSMKMKWKSILYAQKHRNHYHSGRSENTGILNWTYKVYYNLLFVIHSTVSFVTHFISRAYKNNLFCSQLKGLTIIQLSTVNVTDCSLSYNDFFGQ